MTYNTQQTIHALSIAATAASSKTFASVSQMQAWASKIAGIVIADPGIQGFIGSDWSIVWGPVVYSRNPNNTAVIADNAMACYYSPSQKLFVIAIVGTNPISSFDWLDEDFAVSTLVPWPNVSPGAGSNSGNISNATNTGLGILLSLRNALGQTMLQTLATYIKNNNITGATVATCGHSLAGALSPCIALYLYDNCSIWDPSRSQQIAAYPTAGPTPGDNGFAAYYENIIANKGISYTSLYNTLDVVPHAWAPADLEIIPNIYDAYIKPNDQPNDTFLGILVSGMALHALAAPPPLTTWGTTLLPGSVNPYIQISTGRSSLTGSFDYTTNFKASIAATALVKALPSTLNTAYGATLSNVIAVALQAVQQHTYAYYQSSSTTQDNSLLQIGFFYARYLTLLNQNPPANAQHVDLNAQVIHRLTGIKLSKADLEDLDNVARAAS